MTRRLPYPSATNTSLVFGYTVMPAGRLRCSVLLLSAGTPPLPICSRNLPSLVNLRICPSPSPLRVSQTLSFASTAMPCSPLPGRPSPFRRRAAVQDVHSANAECSPPRLNHSYWPPFAGPPHPWTYWPVALNSRTGGAGTYLFSVAFPSSSVCGRWNTQTLP